MFASKTQSLIIGDNRRCKAARCIVALVCVFTLVYTKATIAADVLAHAAANPFSLREDTQKVLTQNLANIFLTVTALQ